MEEETKAMFRISNFNDLITITLQGNQRWQWAPILLARVSLGLFFAISGGNKLFVAENHAALIETLVEAQIPFPEFTSVFLASVELFGGSLLVVGLLSTFCAIALTIAMIVAIITVEIHTIPAGLSFLDWLDYFLYLPQVMYVLIFLWLMVSGPGPVSLDSYLARAIERFSGGAAHTDRHSLAS
jgi:putative oxidoreductase